MGLVAGVDEAGRGPLAGPVVAAAVILDPLQPIAGLRDSKALGAHQRETIAQIIRRQALAWAVAQAAVEEIDAINILQASLLAMQRAVRALARQPHSVLVDGIQRPRLPYPTRSVVKGDRHVAVISAASILAKVARDAEMVSLDQCYPQYGFARHKGYATPTHLASLRRHGACIAHRRSFRPVREVLTTVES